MAEDGSTGSRPAKREIRSQVKKDREHLDPQWQALMDMRILDVLKGKEAFKKAKTIYAYVSLPREAGTRQVLEYLWKEGRQVAAPKIHGRDMAFYLVDSYDDLEPGCMGILEPKEGCRQARDFKSLVLVPGLAFDQAGHRVGYGGGYYDRFFAAEPGHQKVGVAYGFQVFKAVPWEAYDCVLDSLVVPG